MCQEVGQAVQLALSRRGLLKAGAGAGMAALSLMLGGAPASAATPTASADDGAGFDTRLVLLGTAGGPAWFPGSTRHGIASALQVRDLTYMIDCGDGAARQLAQAMMRSRADPHPFRLLEPLQALFFTHLHSDHVVDYDNLLLQGWTAGLGRHQPLVVMGPGPRGELPPVFQKPGQPPVDPPVAFPNAPTPGTAQMTEHIFRAFATDLNDRIRDYLWPDLRGLVQVDDIALPKMAGFTSPNQTPSPDMEPFEVWADAQVRVTATLVAHSPVFPSFAFRFDSEQGSVVFSGDTGPCRNLVRLAQGVDVLVHEVIDAAWVDTLFPPPLDETTAALKHHLLSAHTSIEDAGRVAEQAGAKTLVLSHVIPHNLSDERLNLAGRHYSGRVVPGHDLATIGVGRRRAG
ncbi:MBL fold metallo-hydrolase [Immundisolibacter sp.]|uniref:MBL fold metallo-hydrolase n=1 Tax=Immundisolibacter sp. TaxID=1934948 RepID=UPI00261C463F|nr:MBL fold metallo-hydrolase [Immundisolibacter sp.]MDD3651881.1 MBL fold metallo-hydrolase [Immundisolibacter sp.]